MLSRYFACGLAAQSNTLDFTVFGFEDGLSHRNCFGITQDSTGFIWIGTINGLNRFDGEHFDIFGNSTGSIRLPQNFITDLAFQKPDEVWLTHRNGISKLDIGEHKLTEFKAEKDSQLPKVDWDANQLTLLPGEEMPLLLLQWIRERGRNF